MMTPSFSELSEKLSDKLDWEEISRDIDHVPTDFVLKYHNKINWWLVSGKFSLSVEKQIIFKDFIVLDSYYGRCPIPEELIRAMPDKVDWSKLCKGQSLSDELLHDIAQDIPWKIASEYQFLNENFMRAHATLLNWKEIAQSQIFSNRFQHDFRKKPGMRLLRGRQSGMEKLSRMKRFDTLFPDQLNFVFSHE